MVTTIPTTVGYRSTSTGGEVSTMDDALELERVRVPVWIWLVVALLVLGI